MGTSTEHNIVIKNRRTQEALDTVRFRNATGAHDSAKKWSKSDRIRNPRDVEYHVINTNNPNDHVIYRNGHRSYPNGTSPNIEVNNNYLLYIAGGLIIILCIVIGYLIK